MSLSSESSVSNTIPRYLYWSTDFTYWPPNFNNGVAMLFALLALNVILTVLLQLKTIPCDSAYVWHTSNILCNQRTLGQNTQISSANIKWFKDSIKPQEKTKQVQNTNLKKISSFKHMHKSCSFHNRGPLFHSRLHQCFSTFFASRTTLCNKKILGNTKQNFIITIMMLSSVLALLIY